MPPAVILEMKAGSKGRMNCRLETSEKRSLVVGCGPEVGSDCAGAGGVVKEEGVEDEEIVLDLCFLKSTDVNTTGDS